MQNRCSKKLENHCQNGSQNELKSFKISLLRRPLAIDSVDFWPFGAMPKHHVFFGTSLEAQKVEKLAQDAAKGRLARHGPAPAIAFLRIWAPGRPCARGQ